MATTKPTPVYITLKDAAARIGFSAWSIRVLVNQGKLPGYRISDKPGSTIRVKVSDVNALMNPVIPAEIAASR